MYMDLDFVQRFAWQIRNAFQTLLFGLWCLPGPLLACTVCGVYLALHQYGCSAHPSTLGCCCLLAALELLHTALFF